MGKHDDEIYYNDDDMKRKDSLEGEYDHSKEYDPFQVIIMQGPF